MSSLTLFTRLSVLARTFKVGGPNNASLMPAKSIVKVEHGSVSSRCVERNELTWSTTDGTRMSVFGPVTPWTIELLIVARNSVIETKQFRGLGKDAPPAIAKSSSLSAPSMSRRYSGYTRPFENLPLKNAGSAGHVRFVNGNVPFPWVTISGHQTTCCAYSEEVERTLSLMLSPKTTMEVNLGGRSSRSTAGVAATSVQRTRQDATAMAFILESGICKLLQYKVGSSTTSIHELWEIHYIHRAGKIIMYGKMKSP